VKTSRQQRARNRKRRTERRLAERRWAPQPAPMFKASNIAYDVSARDRGVACGGIGMMQLLARRTGLVKAIDEKLHLLKVHLPYHESDHVLNVAFNVLAGGECLQDLELRRNDEVFLDALGAQRIPDPTTAGDFCRRFRASDVESLMDAINEVRLTVWKQQPESFLKEAIIEADGTMAPTLGECKGGMEVSYKGTWGYHPLLVSLANTQEPLYLVNRGANRPSHEGAAERFDRAADLCRQAGFRKVLFRGDTDFSQTAHLDRWDESGIRYLFGMDQVRPLCERAAELPESAWEPLDRPKRHVVATQPRARPENVKQKVVEARGFTDIRLRGEDVAEFEYTPGACTKPCRIVVVRKRLDVTSGMQRALMDDLRLFFYITNDRTTAATDLVLLANDRCAQEKTIGELKSGVHAMQMPVGDLVSNWAYMVMASLAWTLKAWWALLLPAQGRWSERHANEKAAVLKMEFRTFLNAFMLVPAMIVRTGRRLIYRLVSWNPWQHVLLRGADALRLPLRC